MASMQSPFVVSWVRLWKFGLLCQAYDHSVSLALSCLALSCTILEWYCLKHEFYLYLINDLLTFEIGDEWIHHYYVPFIYELGTCRNFWGNFEKHIYTKNWNNVKYLLILCLPCWIAFLILQLIANTAVN